MTNNEFNIDDLAVEQDLKPSVQDVMAGDIPAIRDPEDPVIRLPRGYLHNGKWQTTSSVRELTGADEELLARKKNPLDYFDSVLALGVEHLGDVDLLAQPMSERERILSQLLTGERELLFLAVLRATFGNERDLQFQCGSCGSDYTTTLLLDHDFVLKDTLGFDPPSTYEFTTSKGDVVEYRLVNGADQRAAASKPNATVAEQNSLILSATISRVNGDHMINRDDYVKTMSMRDRRDLINDMEERQPEIDNELELECQSCGVKNKILLNWGDLFRP